MDRSLQARRVYMCAQQAGEEGKETMEEKNGRIQAKERHKRCCKIKHAVRAVCT